MKLTFSVIQLLICLQTYAQVTLRNMSLSKPDAGIMYQLVKNRLQVLGSSQKAHIVSQHGSSVSSLDSNIFVVTPKTLNPDTLLVYAGKKLLLKQIFRIDTMPDPTLQLGTIQSDTATIDEILANNVLITVLKGSLYRSSMPIISFSTTFIGPAGEKQDNTISVEGNMLSKEQKDIIKRLKKNSKILFDDILATDKRTRRLSPYAITIR